ncbi:MAG: sensor histidine kinase [Clostridia bacterium]
MTILGCAIIALVFLAAVIIILCYRRRSKKTLKKLDQMLDIAIEGEFTEDSFDESLFSAVETKLARYLAASTVSAKNLKAEKEKIKSLIADISHQTKTPVANMRLYTELLCEQDLSPEAQSCAAALGKQTEKLQTLIEALVKTSRLETGIIALHPVLNPVQPVIQSAADQILPGAKTKNIKITVKESGGKAVFDPKWTEEALFNLLENAVKYTPQGGQVTIFTTEYPLFTAISVADTGKGIPEEEQPRIFQRFYRGAAHKEEDGIGIGLYLARQIAEGQGGYIKVFSPKGKGTTFSLYLPGS